MKIKGNNICTLFIKLSNDTKSMIIFRGVERSKFSCIHVNGLNSDVIELLLVSH